MGGGDNSIRISRFWYALLLLAMGTVNLGFAGADVPAVHGPFLWGRFIVATCVGVYFYGCAVFHTGGWLRAMWRQMA